jgi:hypothetical protein
MDIEILNMIERDDDMTDIEIRMDGKTTAFLISYAVNDILRKALTDDKALQEQGLEVKMEGEHD